MLKSALLQVCKMKIVVALLALTFVFAFTSEIGANAQTMYPDEWTSTVTENALTDEKTVIIGRLSSDAGVCPNRRLKRGAFVGFSCNANGQTSFIVDMGCYLQIYNYRTNPSVTYRVDKNDPVSSRRFMINDRNVVILNSSHAIEFAKEIMNGEDLIVSTLDYNYSQVITKFAIKGLDVAIAEIQKACNWK